jgi:hypothetical protein
MKPIFILVAATGVVFLTACAGGTNSGPLAQEPGNSSYATAPAKTGQVVSFGLWLPRNPGREAIIESIAPADPAEAKGLLLRYAAVEPNSDCKVGALYGWPPKGCEGDLVPLKGFHVQEGKAAGIMVGAEASKPGRWLVHAFRVRYEIGRTTFEDVYAQGVGLKVTD